jgi:hypothetical protein
MRRNVRAWAERALPWPVLCTHVRGVAGLVMAKYGPTQS